MCGSELHHYLVFAERARVTTSASAEINYPILGGNEPIRKGFLSVIKGNARGRGSHSSSEEALLSSGTITISGQ